MTATVKGKTKERSYLKKIHSERFFNSQPNRNKADC